MPRPPDPESKSPATRGSDRANSQVINKQVFTTASHLVQDGYERLSGVERSELHLDEPPLPLAATNSLADLVGWLRAARHADRDDPDEEDVVLR